MVAEESNLGDVSELTAATDSGDDAIADTTLDQPRPSTEVLPDDAPVTDSTTALTETASLDMAVPQNPVPAPENLAQAPKNLAQAPETRAQAPETRAQAPENQAQAPETRAQAPENQATEQKTTTADNAPITPAEPVAPSPANTEAERAPTVENSTVQVVRQAEQQWQREIEEHLAADRIEQAEARLKQWISAQPKADTPRIWLAKIYINNQLYTAAEPLVRRVETADAQALMGVVYERTGRHSQAAEVFQALFQRQPDQSQWLLFWAVNAENSGQLAKSRQLYQTYLQQFSLENESLRQFAASRLQILGGP